QYAKSCNAAEVGCEEFTNLNTTGGAEQRSYFSQARSCVLDTNPQAATFYTWEGTDTAGFQLKSWRLLAEQNEEGLGAPCNNFPQNSTENSASAVCGGPVVDCALDEANPNCRVFLNETGREFKRDAAKIVAAASDCSAFRRSRDGETWYLLPRESRQCSSANVGCREYKGGQANLSRRILFNNFESKTNENWNYTPALDVSLQGRMMSPDATVLNGRSLRIFAGRIILKSYENLIASQTGLLADYSFKNKTFLIKFLAKAEGPGRLERVYLKAGNLTEKSFPAGSENGKIVNLSSDWNQYTLGPLYYDLADNPSLGIEAKGSNVLLDNIELVEVQDSLYLLTDSWLAKQPAECSAYKRCEAYKDDSNNTFYVERFARLFSDDSAYCRAVIDAQNSNSAGVESFNTDNSEALDNYTVAADDLIYRIIKPENLRPASAAGCTAL
ncbi:MAG: hypothetical protein AAB779_04210, partial [Patescibacteria group bacterium]